MLTTLALTAAAVTGGVVVSLAVIVLAVSAVRSSRARHRTADIVAGAADDVLLWKMRGTEPTYLRRRARRRHPVAR